MLANKTGNDPKIAFQLLYGKFYTLFPVKQVYLTALFFFELGSLICGAAPNSTTFIVGCGIAGLGSAGMFSGALATLAHTVELEKRPVFFSTLGGMYGPASVAGPLVRCQPIGTFKNALLKLL
jgi:MFS family permease